MTGKRLITSYEGSNPPLKDIFLIAVNGANNEAEFDLQAQINIELGELMRDHDTTPLEFISRFGVERIKQIANRKKQQEEEFIDFIIQQALDEALEQVRAVIDFHLKAIEKLLEEIQAKNEHLQLIKEKDEALKKIIEYYQKTGQLLINENGQIQDKIAQQALDYYWQQKGREDSNDLYLQLLKARTHLEFEAQEEVGRIVDLTDAYERHKNDLEKARAVESKLLNGSLNEKELAIKELATIQSVLQENIITESPASEKENHSYQDQKTNEALNVKATNEDIEIIDFSLGMEQNAKKVKTPSL